MAGRAGAAGEPGAGATGRRQRARRARAARPSPRSYAGGGAARPRRAAGAGQLRARTGGLRALADSLLRACPRLQIVATSREALGIAGETAFPVPALTLPEPAATLAGDARLVQGVLASEAGRLFADRAQAALPVVPGGERECRGAGAGLPSPRWDPAGTRAGGSAGDGVDAGAARPAPGRLLRPADRRPADGRAAPADATSRARLEPRPARASRNASSCGGCRCLRVPGRSRPPRSVCAGDGPTADEILPLLVQLVEKSLVLVEEQQGAARYRLLVTVRQYAAEKLREAGEEAALRDRHLEWLAAVAEQAEEPLWSADLGAWFARLKAAEDNLAAALAWSTRTPAQPEHGSGRSRSGAPTRRRSLAFLGLARPPERGASSARRAPRRPERVRRPPGRKRSTRRPTWRSSRATGPRPSGWRRRPSPSGGTPSIR